MNWDWILKHTNFANYFGPICNLCCLLIKTIFTPKLERKVVWSAFNDCTPDLRQWNQGKAQEREGEREIKFKKAIREVLFVNHNWANNDCHNDRKTYVNWWKNSWPFPLIWIFWLESPFSLKTFFTNLHSLFHFFNKVHASLVIIFRLVIFQSLDYVRNVGDTIGKFATTNAVIRKDCLVSQNGLGIEVVETQTVRWWLLKYLLGP